jgi:hypothetical protein
VHKFVDATLLKSLDALGAVVYRAHGLGYLLVRTESGHTWDPGLEYFIAEDRITSRWEGFFANGVLEATEFDLPGWRSLRCRCSACDLDDRRPPPMTPTDPGLGSLPLDPSRDTFRNLSRRAAWIETSNLVRVQSPYDRSRRRALRIGRSPGRASSPALIAAILASRLHGRCGSSVRCSYVRQAAA